MAQPGASVAAVAMAHRLNANRVCKWRDKASRGCRRKVLGCHRATSVIELRRGAKAMSIHWPVQKNDEKSVQTVRWSDEATTDLVESIDHIEQRNAIAAKNLLAAIMLSA